ncbi:MAG: TonB-dependent receptor [Proteobacteria bacterium]|nr:TonB-dependent receptor [Pseudomonadota bacterium]
MKGTFNQLIFCTLLRFSIVVAATCLLWAPPALAGDKTAEMEEIVVTATRTEKGLAAAPGSVSVVTQKEMEKRNINTADEALQLTAGVVANRAGIRDTMSSLTLGGLPSQSRTLVLLDGLAINSPYSGGIDLSGVAIEDLQKIEVVKGPFSSLYGGGAMGGVVQMITKMPDKRELTVKGGYGTAWSRGEAPNDLISFYASGGDKIGENLRLFLSYGYKSTSGYPSVSNVQSAKPTAGLTGWSETTDSTGAKRYLIGDKGSDGWRNDNIAFKASYDLSKTSKVNVQFQRATYDYYNDDFNSYLRDASGNEVRSYGTVKEGTFLKGAGGSERNLYNMGFETELCEQAKVKLALGYVDQAKRWYVTPTSASATSTGGPGKLSDTPTASYNADLQATIPLFKRHIVTVGGAYKTGWSDSQENNLTDWRNEKSSTDLTYQAKGKDRTWAVFIQDEIQLLEKLTAYIGGREDWWETYDGYVYQSGTAGYPKYYESRKDSSFSPKGALVYKPFGQTTLRTSAGQSFRSPTLYDLYRTWTTRGGVTYNSNPDLKPETATSWNVGVDQGLWKGARVAATYFENDIKDMIYTKTVSATQKDKVNAGKGRSRGIELETEQRFDKWLRFFANFTYTDSSIIENEVSPKSVGKDMTDIPRVMFNIGGDFEKGPFGLSLTGRYMGKRYSNDDNSDTASHVYGANDDFFTADVKASYKVTSWATAAFSVTNILDREYYSYSLAPGRAWFLELTLKF